MPAILDQLDPAEITGYARLYAETLDADNMLAEYLPNLLVEDVMVEINKQGNITQRVAEYTAPDTTAPLGSREYADSKISMQIPPMRDSMLMGEYDAIRVRNNPDDAVVTQAFRDVESVTQALVNRVNRARAEAMETAQLALPELPGVSIDYGDSAARKETVAVAWTDTANSNAYDDYLEAVAAYDDLNDWSCGAVAMSNASVSLFMRSAQVRSVVGATASVARFSDVQDALQADGYPPIRRFNRKVAGVPLLSDNVNLYLPETGVTAGNTAYGLAAEASDAGLAGTEAPGIVVKVDEKENPKTYVTFGIAWAVPILGAPNAFYAQTR